MTKDRGTGDKGLLPIPPPFRGGVAGRAHDAGAPMGNGAVEAANTMIVSTRLKRSDQSWGRAGGLTFHARLTSVRFDNI